MSEASREVANLTERKNPLTPEYDVREIVCLSVCLLHYFFGKNENKEVKRIKNFGAIF